MARVNAVTNGSGYNLVGGLDLQGLRTEQVLGTRLDPWELIKNATDGVDERGYKYRYGFKDFFEEDKGGELVYPKLDKYNLLARHVQRELGIAGANPCTYVSSYGGAKLIEVYDVQFLIHAGKIFRRDTPK
jgi:hypothetical protein|tara:strand:- start:1022 stop:1414 length:393 start_codon:yes stop_codon:yes gene_type:complete